MKQIRQCCCKWCRHLAIMWLVRVLLGPPMPYKPLDDYSELWIDIGGEG